MVFSVGEGEFVFSAIIEYSWTELGCTAQLEIGTKKMKTPDADVRLKGKSIHTYIVMWA